MAVSADILIAATDDVDDRLLECLADCSATFVRTFEEAQRVLRERWFRMIVIDLNFDNVRMFDLLQHVRSLASLNGVPVVCVQGFEAGVGIGAALDRLVRKLGAKAFVDLRGGDDVGAGALQRLCHIVGPEAGMGRSGSAKDGALREPDRPLCILVIDHDIDAAHRLGELIEQTGHDVDFAYSGTAGLDAARRLRPDVVFVDSALAPLDAYQVARRLRREPGLDNVFIALVAAANEEDRQRMREEGIDAHVVKAVDLQSVHRLLDARIRKASR